MLKQLNVETQFIDGLRVTDSETARVAEMVLYGAINKELVSWIGQAGARAVGISGKDGGFVTATSVRRTQRDTVSNPERLVDMVFVGEPTNIDRTLLYTIRSSGIIPVARTR